MVRTFVPASDATVQADHGHIQAEGSEFSQRTNSHRYDATRDVVGVINSLKPQHHTTIYVTLNYKVSSELLDGQWIPITILLSVRDWNGLPPRKFYGATIAIGNNRAGRDVAWQQTTWRFKGFPTQAQFVQVHVIRRAYTLGGDFGTVVPATQHLYVASTVLTYGGYSNAPSTPIGGYGFGYGQEYGTQL